MSPHVLFVQMPGSSRHGRPRGVRSPYLDLCPGRCWARENVVEMVGTSRMLVAHADATNYQGPGPVVAHPPCRAWGRLKYFAKPREGERGLALYALQCVRSYGGVLEHPKCSGLWKFARLPKPHRADDFPMIHETDQHGGWSLEVDQHRFGHRCEKLTWLYFCGPSPARVLDLLPRPSATKPTHTIGAKGIGNGGLPQISTLEREHTPPAFARFLLDTLTL